MNKIKFTKGPWSVPGTPIAMVYGPNGERICRLIDRDDDAFLIAAAPDLLEACEDIFQALINRIGGLPDSTFTDPYFKIRNAIAKATDTQQKLR